MHKITKTLAPKIIVVADDEPFILQAYQEGLQRAGYKILTAADGATALKLAKDHKPDLILLDLIMPDLNGFEVLEKLKHNRKLKNIPVIVVSNISKATDEHEVRSLGAIEFVVKSNYSLKDIVSIVRKTIEKPSK